MTNIVELKAAVPVNDRLIARLEEMLTWARSGDMVSIAYAASRRDHARLTGWVNPPAGYGHDQAAAVMELNHRYARMLTDTEDCGDI